VGEDDRVPPPRIDIADDTFVKAPPARLRPLFDDPDRLANLWPHLDLVLVRDRGARGCRWRVTGAVDGDLEIWLEPWWDGAIVHHYLRGHTTVGQPADLAARHTRRWKAAIHRLKDSLEGESL
jgi:hypothetical protein